MLENLQQGDVLINNNGDKVKILGICGEAYLRSMQNDFERTYSWNTLKELDNNGFTKLEVEKPWPQQGNEYFYNDSDGDCFSNYWIDSVIDEWRKATNNIFRTEAECEANKAKVLKEYEERSVV